MPPIEGEKWNFGAVSTAEWTGVPLTEVLRPSWSAAPGTWSFAALMPEQWRVDRFGFARSLPLDQARATEALLAYAMNGEPLPIQHGAPLRLVVPSWYAVASVKW